MNRKRALRHFYGINDSDAWLDHKPQSKPPDQVREELKRKISEGLRRMSKQERKDE